MGAPISTSFELELRPVADIGNEILKLTVVPYAAAERTNGMASVFTGHEPNRACLEHSRQTSSWPPTPPTSSPSSSFIDSLTPFLKDVQRC
ncbi:hypothetical protein TNCV_1750201 [Trichonephila clavipes]|nr:hypothetical protein TNCV_1750201 [Trichonephila clavipes]